MKEHIFELNVAERAKRIKNIDLREYSKFPVFWYLLEPLYSCEGTWFMCFFWVVWKFGARSGRCNACRRYRWRRGQIRLWYPPSKGPKTMYLLWIWGWRRNPFRGVVYKVCFTLRQSRFRSDIASVVVDAKKVKKKKKLCEQIIRLIRFVQVARNEHNTTPRVRIASCRWDVLHWKSRTSGQNVWHY